MDASAEQGTMMMMMHHHHHHITAGGTHHITGAPYRPGLLGVLLLRVGPCRPTPLHPRKKRGQINEKTSK